MTATARKGIVCLTVDNLGDALAVGRGRAARPDPDEQSLCVGLPALLDLFAEFQLRTTFFVEGWNALHHAEVIERIAADGHEIGLHGWLHEYWAAELDDRTREQLLWDGTAALRLAGFDPTAFRAPGGYRGSHTLEVLSDLGYRVDSSIETGEGGEDQTPELEMLHGEILSIPWTFDLVDYWHYVIPPDGPRAPVRVAEHWMEKIAAAAARSGLVTLIVHPFVSGVDPARMTALRRVLAYAVAHPDIEVRSAEQVADVYPEWAVAT
ncbi:polysaccharide deacetylase family protein [Nocardia vinacea]|uniref:polysaccharide deacetylase family protein n=1 Tax=Nocardia vinacea TaxID=96468 RepID=UPI003418CF99